MPRVDLIVHQEELRVLLIEGGNLFICDLDGRADLLFDQRPGEFDLSDV